MYIIETPRLGLREWRPEDGPLLAAFLQDPQVMIAYEHAFSDEEVADWLKWNLTSYQEHGYGLWALEELNSKEVIGECGLTLQRVQGQPYLEIGYHLRKAFWHQGYAAEAAAACKNYAFTVLQAPKVVSIIRDSNLASMNVAIRNGMTVEARFVKYYQGMDMPHYLFTATNQHRP